MDHLNRDEFFLIVKFLKLGELLAISETSQHLHNISGNPYVWKYFLEKDFPEYQRLGLPGRKETYRLLSKLVKLNQIIGSSDDFYELYLIDNLEFCQGQLMSQRIIEKLEILTNLKSLYMTNNQIIEFPTKMNQLETLYLDRNQIQKLPEQIGQLTNLEILSLSQNKIKTLPKEIGQLTNLQELYLDDNKLTEIPKEIGHLTGLEILNLSYNWLEDIPIEMNQLTNLTDLELDGNYMSIIPAKFDNLSEFDICCVRCDY